MLAHNLKMGAKNGGVLPERQSHFQKNRGTLLPGQPPVSWTSESTQQSLVVLRGLNHKIGEEFLTFSHDGHQIGSAWRREACLGILSRRVS
jgi:hypothetical protein